MCTSANISHYFSNDNKMLNVQRERHRLRTWAELVGSNFVACILNCICHVSGPSRQASKQAGRIVAFSLKTINNSGLLWYALKANANGSSAFEITQTLSGWVFWYSANTADSWSTTSGNIYDLRQAKLYGRRVASLCFNFSLLKQFQVCFSSSSCRLIDFCGFYFENSSAIDLISIRENFSFSHFFASVCLCLSVSHRDFC